MENTSRKENKNMVNENLHNNATGCNGNARWGAVVEVGRGRMM